MIEMIDRNKNAIDKESQQKSKSQLVGLLPTQLTLIAISFQRTAAEIINV